MPAIPDDLPHAAARLWRNVDKKGPDECWLWRGCTDHGYGRITVRIQGRWYSMTVHRLAYLLTHGSLPVPPLVVRHLCGVPVCCNPAHLEQGTVRDNHLDRERHGRMARGEQSWAHQHPERAPRGARNGAYTRPERRPTGDRNGSRTRPERLRRGSAHPDAKLTEEDVRAIRAAADQGMSYKALARRYGVSDVQIGNIVARRSWRHVL